MIISHIKYIEDKNDWLLQSNKDHCDGVAKLADKFASEFGMCEWGRVLGLLHDKGKEQITFQQHIKKESGYSPTIKVIGDFNHSYVGALIAKKQYKELADFLSPQIAGHHRGLYDYDSLINELKKEIPSDVSVDKELIQLSTEKIKDIKCKEDWHHMSRMLYSCLVDADFLDTESFMDSKSAELRMGKATLEELYPKLDLYLHNLNDGSKCTDVNLIRNQVQCQCAEMSSSVQGFYSLTVPTGGGKTLSSLVWAMKHALHNKLHRIIIAIPYTSIIVQTASVLKSIFGEENVLEHYSNMNIENINDEKCKKMMQLATENWDYPIIVTTNVQLFESMIGYKPSDCRKLHNIVNSVLILDEVQTLPTDFLQPIVDTLKTYNRLFNVSVLLTTASQPVLSGIIEGCCSKFKFKGIDEIKEIIPSEYNLHNRLKRVKLEIDNGGNTYEEIAEKLKYHKRVLCIVNTRKDAKELYCRLPKEGITLHLSRMMCPEHIMTTIKILKESLINDDNTIIRVIATQLIEAGVDIDFPVVYRQESGLDSVLQAAGRCNREGKYGIGITYVFSLSKEKRLLQGSIKDANNARLALGDENDWFDPQVMTKYFEQLYCRKESFDIKDLKFYLYNPRQILFETASKKFKLIDDNSIAVIVNWKDSLELVSKLKKYGPSYQLMHQLSKYTVGIRENDMKKLKEMGCVEEQYEGVFVIEDRNQYNKNIGLCTDNHWLEEILII